MSLSGRIGDLAEFRLITKGDQLPAFAFTTSDAGSPAGTCSRCPGRLRERGWQVPASTFPENREDLAVLRVVCRNGFSLDLADLFFKDLLAAVDNLKQEAGASVLSGPAGFRHCSRTPARARVRGC